MKILLIRFSSIGDIVLTTPVIRCLKKQLNAEVHYLTKESFATLLEANPYLSKIFTIEKKVTEVLPKLRKEGYDYIIDLHKNLRSWQVRWGLNGVANSFHKLNVEKWLMVNFKINRLPNVHIVDRYLAAVKPLGIHNDGAGLDYFLPKDFIFSLPLKPFSYTTFAIGAAHMTKRLPVEKILEICQKIETPLVLLGGKDVAEEGVKIANEAGSHVYNFCGKLSLHESAACIRDTAKVITHDTGMMHIAAAFQKNIISIWGNTIPEFGMYPYYKNDVQRNTSVEIKNLNCRPCSKIGFEKCPKGHFKCMTELPLEEIFIKKAPH